MVAAEREAPLKVEVHNDAGLVAAGSISIADLWQVRAALFQIWICNLSS